MHFESGLLSVEASGDFSLENRHFWAYLRLLPTIRPEKILFDGRNVIGKPGDMERFYYGEFAATEIAQALERT